MNHEIVEEVYNLIIEADGAYLTTEEIANKVNYSKDHISRIVLRALPLIYPDIHYVPKHGYCYMKCCQQEDRLLFDRIHDIVIKNSESGKWTTSYNIMKLLNVKHRSTANQYAKITALLYGDIESVSTKGYKITK